jgi:hypothetical protein
MYMPNWPKRTKKQKETPKTFTPSLPLTWWIDDLTHEVCGLVDDPERGLSKMPWPDCDKVYLAVNKEAYDELLAIAEKSMDSQHELEAFKRKYAQ